MAFSYDEWKKKDSQKRSKTSSLVVPSYDEFKASRTSKSSSLLDTTPIRSYYAHDYDKTKKSDKARQADADRFARGHKDPESPKSEKAKKADTDRFAAKALGEEERRVERARKADADRFAANALGQEKRRLEQVEIARQTDAKRFEEKYTTEQARLNHQALKNENTQVVRPNTQLKPFGLKEKEVPKPLDEPTSKADKDSILDRIFKGSMFDNKDVQLSPFEASPYKQGGIGETEAQMGVGRGFFKKDNVNDELAEKTGANLRLGLGDTIEGFAGLSRWLANDPTNTIGKGIQKVADKTREGFEDSAYKGEEFSFSELKNPEWLATQIPRAVPQLLTSIIPGIATAGALGKLEKFSKLPKVYNTIIKAIGGAGVTTAIDSSLEAGFVYDEATRRGMDPEKANDAANQTFLHNFALTGGTTFAEFLLALSPAGRIAKKVGNVGDVALRTAGGGILEGFQEGAQEGISANALGDDFSWTDPSTLEAITIGTILGGTVTGTMSTAEKIKDSMSKTPSTTENPLPNILERAIQQMPEEIRREVEQEVARQESSGIPRSQATENVIEELIQEVPELERVLVQATDDYMNDKRLEMESTSLNPLAEEAQNLKQAQEEEQLQNEIPLPSNPPLDGETPIMNVPTQINPINPVEATTGSPGLDVSNENKKVDQVVPEEVKPLKTPVNVELGDTVKLEGTRASTTYEVEAVDNDTVQLRTPSQKSIKVPKSKILQVLNRSVEGDIIESSSIEPLGKPEKVGNITLPPNFRQDVHQIINEFMTEENMSLDEAVETVKADEYYAGNPEWSKIIDEEATKGFGYAPKNSAEQALLDKVGVLKFWSDFTNQERTLLKKMEKAGKVYIHRKGQGRDTIVYPVKPAEAETSIEETKEPAETKEPTETEAKKFNFTLDDFEPKGEDDWGLFALGSDDGTLKATIHQSASQEVLDALERAGYTFSKKETVGKGKAKYFHFTRKGTYRESKEINKELNELWDKAKAQKDKKEKEVDPKHDLIRNYTKQINEAAMRTGIKTDVMVEFVVDMNEEITSSMLESHNITDGSKAYIAGKAIIEKDNDVLKASISLWSDPSQPVTQEIIHEFAEVWLEVWKQGNRAQYFQAVSFLKSKGMNQERAEEMLAEILTDYTISNQLPEVLTEESVHQKFFKKIVYKFKTWVQQVLKRITFFRNEVWEQLSPEIQEQAKLFEQGKWDEAFKNIKESTFTPSKRFSVKPSSDLWKRGPNFSKVKEMYPQLFEVDPTEETTDRHPTQISSTVATYNQFYDFLESEGFNGTILDASSGLGKGTEAGRNRGLKVDDVEPFPDKNYSPKFTSYQEIQEQYDVVISNAVLNVIPQDFRDGIAAEIGRLLKDGGRAFVNVRGRDVEQAKGKKSVNEYNAVHDENMEYFIAGKNSYQKGFNKKELVAYLQDVFSTLPGDFEVVPMNKKNSGFNANVGAVVTRKNGARFSVKELGKDPILEDYEKYFGKEQTNTNDTEWLKSLKENRLVTNKKTNEQGVLRNDWYEGDTTVSVRTGSGMVKKVDDWNVDDLVPLEKPSKANDTYGSKFEVGDIVYQATEGGSVHEFKVTSKEGDKYTLQSTTEKKYKVFSPFGLPESDQFLFSDEREAKKVAKERRSLADQKHEDFTTGWQRPDKPIKAETHVFIDDSRLKHPRLYKTEELQDIVENLSFDASGFDSKKTFNKYIALLEKEWNKRLDEEEGKTEPAKEAEQPQTAVRNNLDWLNNAAEEARKRIESRKGRALSGLPMDDLVDYSIIGAAKLANKAMDYVAFSEEMLKEFGKSIKLFMPSIFAQSQAMLDMTPDEINEMLGLASQEGTEDVNVDDNADIVDDNVDDVDDNVYKSHEERIKRDYKFNERDFQYYYDLGSEGTYHIPRPARDQLIEKNQKVILSLMSDDDIKNLMATQYGRDVKGHYPYNQLQSKLEYQMKYSGASVGDFIGFRHIYGTNKIEIKTGDGRVLTPTFKEMFRRFVKVENIKEDATNDLGQQNQGTLEESGAGEVQGTESKRSTGTRSNAVEPGDGKSGDGNVSSTRRTESSTKSKESTRSDKTPKHDAKTSGRNESSSNIRKQLKSNFSITTELDSFGGPKVRFQNNINALRLLKQLEDENRLATAEEQQELVRYVGWGGLATAFDPDNKTWTKEFEELKSLVEDGVITQDEYEHARRTTQYAHYTSKPIIESMYKALERMGVKSGRVLEPGMGIGNFFGLTPNGWKGDMVGVEFDSLTGKIAKQLYQKAHIEIKPYQDFEFPEGYFDVTIGNPPYSDTTYDYKGTKHTLHNYFFLKSLDKLRPGGILAFVTSTGTLNSKNKVAREQMGEVADFLGAIRLPSDAFKANAGTEVTTDIIFFQKREVGATPNHRGEFIETSVRTVTGRYNEDITLRDNVYFQQNPDKILGEVVVDKLANTQRLGVKANGDFTEQLSKAIESLPKAIYTEPTVVNKVEKVETVEDVAADIGQLDEGNFAFDKGQLVQVSEGRVIPRKDIKGDKIARIKSLVAIRDVAKEVLQYQAKNGDDTGLKPLLNKLNAVYDGHVKKFKTINSKTPQKPNLTVLQSDPLTASFLRSLEVEKDGEYVKNDVFKERVISYTPIIKNVSTSEEALVASLFQKGRIDLDYMQELSGFDHERILKDLGERLYKNPETGYEIQDEYLSGNVREKLIAAKKAAQTDKSYARNVKALEAVIPEDIPSDDIAVQFGSPWIPIEDYTNFVNSFFGARGYSYATVRYIHQTGDWKIEGKINSAINLHEHAIGSVHGGKKLSGTDIVELLLNSKTPVIKYKDQFENLVVDQEATNLAKLKAQELEEAFHDWLFSDRDREQRLVRKFNDEFNAVVLQDYDGSLIYGGETRESSVPFAGGFNNKKYVLRKHQKNVVWRMLQGGNTLLAHVVGAGKTLEMIVAGMEMKRLGLAQKPLYIVPNNLFDQWGADFRDSYPNAKILSLASESIPSAVLQKTSSQKTISAKFDLSKLVPGDKVSLKGDKKKYTVESFEDKSVTIRNSKGKLSVVPRNSLQFLYTLESDADYEKRREERRVERAAALNRIVMGNYDAVIMTHDTFKKLPMSPKYTQEFIKQQLLDLEFALQAMKGESGNKRTVKKMENAKEKLEKRLKELLEDDGRDIAIPFEMLGIDQLFVDEAHKFKNLQFSTKLTGITGLSNSASKRSEDLYMKTQWLTKTRNGRGVVFATGTPISNTLAEMFTMQRYLQSDRLESLNIKHFDMWAKMFGQTEPSVEMDVAGGFKERTRFKRFRNLPELMRLFKEVTDVKTAPMLNLPRPKNVNFETVIAPLSDQQQAYMDEIVARAADVQGGRVDMTEDNWLKITSDARKMSLDIRLANPTADADPDSKIQMAVDNVFKIWKDGKKVRPDKLGNPINNLTQLVFADLGTPKAAKQNEEGDDVETEDSEVLSFDLYSEMRNKLLALGIPKAEIAFIHEANTQKKREMLFKDMKSGKVRILFGSTEKMGAGMNVQDRLVALHHVDAPWRPSDVEQREGRMVRQGNLLDDVTVYQYVTERSFDRIMWDILKHKAGFIEQLMNDDGSIRELEDVGAMEFRFAHISAASTGDNTIIDKMNIDSKVKSLRSAKEAHRKQIRQRKRTLANLPETISKIKAEVALSEKDVTAVKNIEEFHLKVDGKTYDKQKDAAEVLTAKHKTFKKKDLDTLHIGSMGGFELSFFKKYYGGQEVPMIAIKGERSYQVMHNEVSSVGSLTRIENAIKKIEEEHNDLLDELAGANDTLENLTRTVNATFKQEEELQTALKEQHRLSQKMLKKENEMPTEGESHENTFFEPKIPSRNRNANTDRKAVTRPQIMRFVKDNFQVKVDYKRLRGKGLYKNKFAIIRVKEYGDFEVLAHELGHRIDWKLGLAANRALKKELASIADSNLEIPKSMTVTERAREGVAEIFRQYFYGPHDLENLTETERSEVFVINNMSQELSSFIQDGLKQAGWDGKVQELQGMIQRWLDRSPQEEWAGNVAPFGENVQEKRSFKRRWIEFYSAALDHNYPVKAAQKIIEGDKKLMNDKDAYGVLVATRGSTARAVVYAEIATFNSNFVRTNGQFVKTGEPLMKIIEDVWKIGDVDEFGQYLVAKHMYNLKTEHGKIKSPITIDEETELALAEAEQKYGPLAERLYDFQSHMLVDLLGSNDMVSQEAIEKMQDDYPYYVPLARVKTETGEKSGILTTVGGTGTGFTNTQQGIKKMSKYGSTAMVINPIETIMKNVFLFTSIADRNAVGKAFASWADPKGDYANENVGQIVEEMEAPTKVVEIALAQMADTLLNAGLEGDLLEDLDLTQSKKFFSKLFTPNGANSEVLVWVEGKPKLYKIHDPIVYKALIDEESALLNGLLNKVTDVFTKPVDLVKQGITMTPFFTVRIFVSSVMQLMWKTEAKGMNHALYGGTLGKAAWSVIRKKPDFVEWLASGAAQSTMVSSQTKYLQRSMDKVKLNVRTKSMMKFKYKPQTAKEAKELYAYALKNFLMYLPRKMQDFNDVLDSALKLAEYNVMKKQTGSKMEAMKASREADMDYKRIGNPFMQGYNKVDPFFNIAWQGLDAMGRSFIAHPFRQSLRGLFFVIPTFLLALANYEDEEYWELNSYERDLHWLFPKGDGTFYKLRVPFEVGIVFKTFPEKAMFEVFDMISGQDKSDFHDFGKNIRNMILPAFVPFVFNLGFKYAVEKDWTTGREFVPQSLQDFSPHLQFTEETSEVGQLLGKWLNKSPMVIDETIKGALATWGSFGLGMTDQVLDATGVVERPDTRGLRRNYWQKYISSSINDGSTQSITTFYEKLDELETAYKDSRVKYDPPLELKHFRQANTDMSDLRKLKNSLIRDELLQADGTKFPKEEKKRQVVIIDKAMRDIARKIQGGEPLDEDNVKVAWNMLDDYQLYLKAKDKEARKVAKEKEQQQ